MSSKSQPNKLDSLKALWRGLRSQVAVQGTAQNPALQTDLNAVDRYLNELDSDLEANQDAVRLATAELPETRSEAALPLRSRGQTLGALTVQDSRPSALDRDLIAALQAMADEVAVALDNARLFAASQAALETARRAYGELSRQAWTELLRPRADWGYRYTQRSVTPADGEWRPEMLQAIQASQRVQADPGANPGGEAADPATLAISPWKTGDCFDPDRSRNDRF